MQENTEQKNSLCIRTYFTHINQATESKVWCKLFIVKLVNVTINDEKVMVSCIGRTHE